MSNSPKRKAKLRDPRKVSVYLASDVVTELRAESQRLDRSLSWLVQKAWRLARDEIRKLASG